MVDLATVWFGSSLCKNTKANKENVWLFLQSTTVFMNYLKFKNECETRLTSIGEISVFTTSKVSKKAQTNTPCSLFQLHHEYHTHLGKNKTWYKNLPNVQRVFTKSHARSRTFGSKYSNTKTMDSVAKRPVQYTVNPVWGFPWQRRKHSRPG